MPSSARQRVGAALPLLLLFSACGGGGGSPSPPAPDPATDLFTVRYLRVEPAYDGWGLHLWGTAIDASVATTWSQPRNVDRIEDRAALFEIPIANETGTLNLVVHNGDLKSPVFDLSLVPREFAAGAWVVQDTVAAVNGNTALPFDNEADARAALDALGNASSALDLGTVAANGGNSALPAGWAERATFIEIYVRAFQDSDGDGVGDFLGLVSRLDYLLDLGVTGLWLMPITESADNDHGYAVQDYRAVEEQYGTMADFELLLSEAHARGIGIVIDYVLNHSSSTNPLFLDASTSSTNDKRDWYVWALERPNGWNTFGGDPWRNNGNGWYYGVFTPLMPDFNLRNPDVVEFHRNNLRFWLNLGVDGFRFDAVGLLYENGPDAWSDAPENHALLAELGGLVADYGGRFVVCEAPSDPETYATDNSCGRAFAFQAPASILNSARRTAVDAGFVQHLKRPNTDRMPLFLSNHDSFAGARVFDQLDGNEEQLRLAAASYLLTSRTPFIYYGEEIGMANAAALSGDRALRTPMSWNSDPVNAGFTSVTPFRELAANSTTHNVEVEDSDVESLLHYYREVLRLRNEHETIALGNLDVQSEGGEPVLVVTREAEGRCFVVAINYGAQSRAAAAVTSCPGAVFAPVFGPGEQRVADDSGSISVVVTARTASVYRAMDN